MYWELEYIDFYLKKYPMNLCACDNEEREHGVREHGVGTGVNDAMMSETL